MCVPFQAIRPDRGETAAGGVSTPYPWIDATDGLAVLEFAAQCTPIGGRLLRPSRKTRTAPRSSSSYPRPASARRSAAHGLQGSWPAGISEGIAAISSHFPGLTFILFGWSCSRLNMRCGICSPLRYRASGHSTRSAFTPRSSKTTRVTQLRSPRDRISSVYRYWSWYPKGSRTD
jgi:hypothetical protein